MGRAKPVHLRDGTDFAKAGDADAAFKAILNKGGVGDAVTGPDESLVNALFLDYCAATNWPLKGKPVGYTRDWNKDVDRTTMCFYVLFDDGTRDDFSYIKAVREVANWVR